MMDTVGEYGLIILFVQIEMVVDRHNINRNEMFL